MNKTLKKTLSIILSILMIVTSVPFALAAGDGVPLTIDVTDDSYIEIGNGYEYYDEDGYIITGNNPAAEILVYEGGNYTLDGVTAESISDRAGDDTVNITIKGNNVFTGSYSFFKADLIINAVDGATLKALYVTTAGNDGTLTVNGGDITFAYEGNEKYCTLNCKKIIINGGTVTASNSAFYTVGQNVELNGGILNVVNTSTDVEAIGNDVIIDKGALLTISSTYKLFHDAYDILKAEGLAENDFFFVRYDTESEFVPVQDIESALNGKEYAEIKIDTHEHSFNNIGKCICGYECPHESITDNKCDNCGAEGTIVTIEMTDSYGDGWNGNAVVIKQFVDGVYTDTEAGTATIEYGAGGTFTTVLPKDGIFALSWLAGDYPSECSFTIAVDGECVYSISDARGIENNAILYTICEHTGGKADCLHRAVCENCGNEYGEVDADGHDWSNKDGICANGCGETCPHSSYTDGVCDNCDYECAHEWGEGVLTRPIKITTTDWDDGYYTYTCSACGHYYHEAVKRADYTALDAVLEDFIDAMYDTTLLDSIRNELQVIYFDNIKVLYGDYIESEQAEVDALVETMTQKLAEVEAGVADGSALKPNYTEGDALINGIIEQFYDKGITYVDEIIAEFDTLYNEYLAIWRKPETTKPQVDEIVGELKALKEKIDKGTEDGTLVKIDGIKEYNKIADALDAELMENYSQEEIAALAEKAGDEINVRFGEIIGKAGDLTGSVAENKDALAEIESEMRALYGEIKNCLDGVHNGFVYEVTEEAKCEVNAIESATCTLCGETDEREVEGSALKHSFTKYEETEAPKCGVAGKEVAYCDNGCQTTDERETPALEHIFLDYVSNGDATCTADGTKTAECINGCGATDTVEDEDSMLDHADEDGDKICDNCEAEIVDVCPDCGRPVHEEKGIPQYICLIITLIKLLVSFYKTVIVK